MIPGLERFAMLLAAAATLIGVGGVVVAQGIFDPQAVTWERLVGGSVVVAAAVFIARYSLVYMREIRTAASEDRDAWMDDRRVLVEQLETTRQILADERDAWAEERREILELLNQARIQLAEATAQLQAERALRASLENMGLVDRRGS